MPNIPSSSAQTPAKKRKLTVVSSSSAVPINIASIEVLPIQHNPSGSGDQTGIQLGNEQAELPQQSVSNGSGDQLISEKSRVESGRCFYESGRCSSESSRWLTYFEFFWAKTADVWDIGRFDPNIGRFRLNPHLPKLQQQVSPQSVEQIQQTEMQKQQMQQQPLLQQQQQIVGSDQPLSGHQKMGTGDKTDNAHLLNSRSVIFSDFWIWKWFKHLGRYFVHQGDCKWC